ncbi:MAG: AAA family ATPase, partial [Cyanobacteria bacterium REEB65]|nr:AAA family ATPase [Cyanobacteria bacterium REEB65]
MDPLRILEIEIDNFKTIRQERIAFLPGFTAISGPNGSGKSNILDALLFALGLGNNRALRAERANDLINNSSSRREARVTVRFGTAGGAETFEIARRVRETAGPNGGPPAPVSTYYLNGKVATRDEVHEVLSRHHISPNGYNVVMQGDVTSIIRMSAVERRKIIDEVAGVADFDHRIDQARGELLTVHEQEDRTSLLLGEIDLRLDGLRAERDQALQYREVEQELKGLDGLGRIASWWDQKDAVAGLEKVLESSCSKSTELTEARDRAQAALDEARTREAELQERIRQEGGSRLEALEERCLHLSTEVEKARLAEDAARRRGAELEASANHDAEGIVRFDARLGDLSHDAIAKAAERQSLEAQALELRQLRERLQQELDELLGDRQGVKAQEDALKVRKATADKGLN